MMQNLNRKNSFEDYGAEPSPLVWEKIEKRLPPPSNKKRRWLLWSAAAALIAGIFFSAYWFDIDIKLRKKNAPEKTLTTTTSSVNKTSGEPGKTSAENKHGQITEKKENNIAAEKEKTVSENISVTKAEERGVKIKMKEENKILSETNETASANEKHAGKKIQEDNKTAPPEEIAVVLTEPVVNEKGLIKNISLINITMIHVPGDSLQLLHTSFIDFQPVKKKYAASRWQWSAAGGENYSYRVLDFSSAANNAMSDDEKNYLSEHERGIRTVAFETGIGYSLSTHFNLNFGIHYFTTGQERVESEVVFSGGDAGTPNTQYSVNTSAGVVTANGEQVDFAVFNNNDTSLFTPTFSIASGPAPQDSSVTQYFKLRQEFSFIGFPLLIQYQMAERRLTPYIGMGFSVGYIMKEKITVNEKAVDSDYRRSTNDIIFFAEAQGGLKYRISNHWFFKLQPSLRYGLNSVNGDDNIKWIPYSTGISGGINFRF